MALFYKNNLFFFFRKKRNKKTRCCCSLENEIFLFIKLPLAVLSFTSNNHLFLRLQGQPTNKKLFKLYHSNAWTLFFQWAGSTERGGSFAIVASELNHTMSEPCPFSLRKKLHKGLFYFYRISIRYPSQAIGNFQNMCINHKSFIFPKDGL